MGAQGYLRIMIHVLVCKDAVQHQTILLSFVWRLLFLFNWMLGFGLAFGCFGLWLRAVESFACLLGPGRQDTPKERTSTTDRRLMNLHRYYRLSWVLQEDSFLSPRPSRRKPMKYVTEVKMCEWASICEHRRTNNNRVASSLRTLSI